MRNKKRSTFRRLGKLLLVIGVLNFVIYTGIVTHLGGTPDYTKSQGGRYFLSSHSNYTEVSEQTFQYVEWYFILSWGGLIVSIIIGITLLILQEGFEIRGQIGKKRSG